MRGSELRRGREGGRNGRVEQVDSASFKGLLAEFIRFVGDQRF